MNKPVWIVIILVLAVTAFDAARPYITGAAAETGASLIERTELWSFVAFVALLGAVLLYRRLRARK